MRPVAQTRLVLTGPPGSGKTTQCRRLATAARRRGLVVHGLLTASSSPAERSLEDMGSGACRLLAREAPPAAVAAGGPRWELDDGALAWGDDVLRGACPADLLIVDEVGPVELLHRRGWLGGVEAALAGSYGMAVAVVRPWLVPRFLQLFPDFRQDIVDLADPGSGRLLDARLEALTADAGSGSGPPRVGSGVEAAP